MKKFLKGLLLATLLSPITLLAQSHTIPSTDSNNNWTGSNTFVLPPTVPTPVAGTDAANKTYVDTHGGGSTFTPPSKVMWTDPLTGISTTATPAEIASQWMNANGGTPCTDGIIDGDGKCYVLPALQALASDGNGKPTTIGEIGYTCTGSSPQTCTVAWHEDEAAGIFDPRRPRTFDNQPGSPVTLATDCAQAIKNTINAAACAVHSNTSLKPIIKLPAGHFTGCGKGTVVPGGMTILGQEGGGAGDYGGATFLATGDPTQPMFEDGTGTASATCNGVTVSQSQGGASYQHFTLTGNGTTSPNDIGLKTLGTSAQIFDVAATGFGGPGLYLSGLNSHGNRLFGQSNLAWYMFGGTYNVGAFTDTNWHGSIELWAQDGKWDHVVVYGWLQDTGWYNRYYLTNTIVAGGPGTRLSDSFLQIGPHNVVVPANTFGSNVIVDNRFDDAWFESVITHNFGSANVTDNDFQGYCTSTLLNPANFATDPGGVSPVPNCTAMSVQDGGVGGTIVRANYFGQVPAQWASWAKGDVYLDPNTLGGSPNWIDQKGNIILGGAGSSWCCGNPGSDVSGSQWGMTIRASKSVATSSAVIPFGSYHTINLSSTAATTWTGFTSNLNDVDVEIVFSQGVFGQPSFDTVANSATINTCGGQPIVGAQQGTQPRMFHIDDNTLHEICPSGDHPQTRINGYSNEVTIPSPNTQEPFGVVGNAESQRFPDAVAMHLVAQCGGSCGSRSSTFVIAYRNGSSWVCTPPATGVGDGTISGDGAFITSNDAWATGTVTNPTLIQSYVIYETATSNPAGPGIVFEGTGAFSVGTNNFETKTLITDPNVPATPCAGGVNNTSGRGMIANAEMPTQANLSDICRQGEIWNVSNSPSGHKYIAYCTTDNPLGTTANAITMLDLNSLDTTLYNAATNPLPTCSSANSGTKKVVSDATSPTYMGAYAGSGQVVTEVICSTTNGTTFAWVTK